MGVISIHSLSNQKSEVNNGDIFDHFRLISVNEKCQWKNKKKHFFCFKIKYSQVNI